jgi:hypothetical protein
MLGLFFAVGLALGFAWGLVVAREVALALMAVEAAIEDVAASSFFVK